MWWLKYLDQFTHIGAPAALAGATYALFHFLDKTASGVAKETITGWIRGDRYNRFDLQSAMLLVFDKLYCLPFGVRTIIRSATLTTLAFLLTQIYWMWIHNSLVATTWGEPRTTFEIAFWLSNIISDLISLFFVRLWFRKTSERIGITMSLLGCIIPSLIGIVACYYAAFVAASVLGYQLEIFDYISVTGPSGGGSMMLGDLGDETESEFLLKFFLDDNLAWIMLSSLLMFIWLPLCFFGYLGLRFLNIFLYFIDLTQWFIKRGNQHPLRAIGVVASGLVFVIAVATHGL
jgi:hypothetical protein